MENFSYYNPTKLIFGKGQLEQLKQELKKYGKRVLLVYGGGSIKRNGLYDQVTGVLREEGADWHELSGVEPNPRLATVQKESICADSMTSNFFSRSAEGASSTAPKRLRPASSTRAILGTFSAKNNCEGRSSVRYGFDPCRNRI